jgi:hypothetical protein
MGSITQHGYLVSADISGYPSFAAKTELEHSHAILSKLLNLVMEKITRGETLLEFLEDIHVAFHDRQISIKRVTICTCLACQATAGSQ